MPVSSSVHLSDCLDHIIRLNPASVLDIGCGFGLWGFLCREYLDVWQERVQPEQWQVRIDGVELWEPYIQSHQRALYNNILISDVRDVVGKLDEYDLIIAGDVMEHLDKAEAETVIDYLYDRARRALLVNIPLTGNWDHPENYGNPGELHRSQWSVVDFAQYAPLVREYRLGNGEYGSFFCAKECDPELRFEGLVHAAHRRDEFGDVAGAVRAWSRAQAIDPAAEDIAIQLTDALLRLGDQAGAAEALSAALAANPHFHYGRLTLARLLSARDKAAALRELQALLADGTLEDDLRAQALQLATRLEP
ncbi:MAG: hypothetical protein GC168_09010 [Candidatus Hydrogenedens sp.]|nr:hypothetical protein [Candidatus Hydrogenedens sp.]